MALTDSTICFLTDGGMRAGLLLAALLRLERTVADRIGRLVGGRLLLGGREAHACEQRKGGQSPSIGTHGGLLRFHADNAARRFRLHNVVTIEPVALHRPWGYEGPR